MDRSTTHDPKYVPDLDFIEESSQIYKNAALSRIAREKMDYSRRMGEKREMSRSKKFRDELKKGSLSRVLSPNSNKHLRQLKK